MDYRKIFSNKYVKNSILVFSGILVGWLFFYKPAPEKNKGNSEIKVSTEKSSNVWTCAMHPQIRKEKEGSCPICGMDLIPLQKMNVEIDAQAIELSREAMKLAEVETSIVGLGRGAKKLLLYGKIEADESRLQTQTAHIPGRIEQLYVNVTGEPVHQGQLMARIYSPELISAQKELLEAMVLGDKYPELHNAAREKLLNWKLTAKQISDIEESNQVQSSFNLYSNTSGIVVSRNVNMGDYISKGATLFEVADLTRLWAVFDAYGQDLQWISKGQKIEFTVHAIPGETFKGKVSFIDQVVDPLTRVARIRAEIGNNGQKLKLGMFIYGTIEFNGNEESIIIPQSAVLWTGKHSYVFVKIPLANQSAFKIRPITLGASLNNYYIVLNGLEMGEEIVTHGTFSVDAAAQLAGKPSMMDTSAAVGELRDGFKNGPKGAERIVLPINAANLKVDNSGPKTETVGVEVHFRVNGNCELCKQRIEKAIQSMDGVSTAEWNMETKLARVVYNKNKTSLEDIQKAIASVGHDTEQKNAPKAIYDNLPGCCQYRSGE